MAFERVHNLSATGRHLADEGVRQDYVAPVFDFVTRRPKRVGSISPPALFRAVEQFQPTLLDETEKYIEHGSDLHALINEGHCKGATVWRVLGEKLELREFAVFGAVAFARNGQLPDDLEQRSIIVEMQRRLPGEPLEELTERRSESFQQLARKVCRWTEDSAAQVGDADPDMSGIINRIRDNWRPLFAIADVIGEEWPERIREAAAVLTAQDSESTGPLLLADIKAEFDTKKVDRLASTGICDVLNALEGRPWADWKASQERLAQAPHPEPARPPAQGVPQRRRAHHPRDPADRRSHRERLLPAPVRRGVATLSWPRGGIRTGTP